MLMRRYVFTLFVIILSIVSGCRNRNHDASLDSVAAIVSDRPDEAMLRLDSIDYAGLSESDRHLHDLLSIKARDKAYVQHKSDSLILDVIGWYASHRDSGLYPEALYYGGRVYSDLGDYPTALRYFQQALDELADDTNHTLLKSAILSQTGRLLNNLRLYKEAQSYVVNAIENNRIFGDIVNEAYNLQLLGSIQLRMGLYDKAESNFKKSIAMEFSCSESFKAMEIMYLGAVKYHQGQIDSALNIIRKIPKLIDPLDKNYVYAYAAQIYKKSGILDTAYFYAHELINSKYDYNKQIGYHILLSPELTEIIQHDSLVKYTKDYSMLIEKRYDENENQLALNQQALYNYQLHDINRKKAEKSKTIRENWIVAIVILLIIVVFVMLIQRTKNQRNIIQLHQALDSINRLKHQLSHYENKSSKIDTIKETSFLQESKDVIHGTIGNQTAEKLRERLKGELMALYESSEKQPVSSVILNSEVYAKLLKMIENGKPLKDNDEMWEELKNTVLESSPNFMSNLNLLTFGNLTAIDIKTALLLKCGMKPSQLSVLFVRSNGAIISRREMLSVKIFDKKIGVKVLDGIIRLL